MRSHAAPLLLIACLLVAPPIAAQETINNASVSGRVVDQQGAAIPDATVTATAIETGVSVSTTTDQGGRFRFPYLKVGTYRLEAASDAEMRRAASRYVHYIHGTNPLSIVYLTNMYAHGGDNCANEIFHSWFADGSAMWDRAGTSTYGPPPGYPPPYGYGKRPPHYGDED